MNNTFKEIYEAVKELHKRYDAAKKENNESLMESMKEEYQTIQAKIEAEWEGYQRIYQLYSDMRDRGNDYIDLNDFNENDTKKIIELFRKYEVKKFTFSSTWSSAVNVGWLFIQNGCRLDGMVEINSRYTKFMSDEYEKVPAYVYVVE